MEWTWVNTTISILFLFAVIVNYWIGYKHGIRIGREEGMRLVLSEWKRTLEIEGDDIND